MKALLVACLVLSTLSVACTDESDSASTPATYATTTVTATSPLAAPKLPAGLRSLGEGRLPLQVLPNSRQVIDPLAVARQATSNVPACAQYVFVFSWQVPQGQSLKFQANRQGGVIDLGQGREGEASVSGCVALEAINETSSGVNGEMRYLIATSGP